MPCVRNGPRQKVAIACCHCLVQVCAYVHMKEMMTGSEAVPAGKMRATFIIQRCDLQSQR